MHRKLLTKTPSKKIKAQTANFILIRDTALLCFHLLLVVFMELSFSEFTVPHFSECSKLTDTQSLDCHIYKPLLDSWRSNDLFVADKESIVIAN